MTAIFPLLFSVGAAAFGMHSPNDDVPEVLRRAYLERARFRTAYLQYRIVHEWPDLPRTEENIEARFDADSVYLINSGDDDGIREKDPETGVPAFGVQAACLPEKAVLDRKTNQWWVVTGGLPQLAVSDERQRPTFSDVRSFGLFSREVQHKTPAQMLDVFGKTDTPDTFRVEKGQNGLRTVVLTYEPAGSWPHLEYRWVIDTKRDYAMTRVLETAINKDGSREILSEVHADYAVEDGRWWPRRIESTNPRSGWYCSVEYQHVEFDKPEHPRHLGPETIGVPIGVIVYSSDFAGMNPPSGRYLGDGVIAHESEWRKIKHQYDLAPLKDFYAAQYRLGDGYFPAWWDASDDAFGLKDAAYRPNAWEAWVRRWIIKHTSSQFHPVAHPVDGKQRHTAWAILKESRERADPIRRRIDEELRKIDRVLRATGADPTAPDRSAGKKTGDSAVVATGRLAAARKRREELEHPKAVEAIFTQLKRRLDGLLTSGQRQAEAPTGDAPLAKPRRLGGKP